MSARKERMVKCLMDLSAYENDPAVLKLTQQQEGALFRLVRRMWQMPEPGVVKADDDLLCAITRTPEAEWPSTRAALEPIFDADDSRPGCWIDVRMVESYRKQNKYREGQRKHGIKGARARWGGSGDPGGDPIATPTANRSGTGSGTGSGSGSGSGTSSGTGPHTQRERSARPKATAAAEAEAEHPDFAEWYSRYPLKKNKPAASRAYAEARAESPELTREFLLDAVAEYVYQRNNTSGDGFENQDWWVHPANWLKGRRWEDEYEPADD